MADKIRIDSNYDLQGNYDPSDSEGEYTSKEKKLLENFRKRKRANSDTEEEVYAFSESDDDSVDKADDLGVADSDIEGQEKSDDDLPDSKAWGKKNRSYYSTDYVDEDYGGFGNEEQAALMEEEETKAIQKRLLEQFGEEDFAFDVQSQALEVEDDKKSIVKSDLTTMSKRQKMQLLQKESPEFLGLIDDFKSKLTVAKDDLQPVLNLVKNGKLPKCDAAKFIKTNYDLILNYCTNITFYLLLKSQKTNIHNHPVVKRLFQYRQMLNKMEPIYLEVIKPQIDRIMKAVSENIQLHVIENKMANKKRKSGKTTPEPTSKKLKLINTLEKDEDEDTGVSDDEDEYNRDILTDKSKSENITQDRESDESGFSDNDSPHQDNEVPSSTSHATPDDVVEKRDITYQIAKNKGLTPHRKKEQRNPRVKNKIKFRKAKIRRKGAVREVRTEINRYAGEASGIKANVKKGIKIK